MKKNSSPVLSRVFISLLLLLITEVFAESKSECQSWIGLCATLISLWTLLAAVGLFLIVFFYIKRHRLCVRTDKKNLEVRTNKETVLSCVNADIQCSHEQNISILSPSATADKRDSTPPSYVDSDSTDIVDDSHYEHLNKGKSELSSHPDYEDLVENNETTETNDYIEIIA